MATELKSGYLFERVKILRASAGITHDELADKIGMTTLGLRHALTRNTLQYKYLIKVAENLNCPIQDLFYTPAPHLHLDNEKIDAYNIEHLGKIVSELSNEIKALKIDIKDAKAKG